ncbi:MAG: ribonuclease Z [Thermodesulfobacteriota bacterium]|nr:ribonuclease Z [Thermodesulfobacteriota bacterium]
MRPSFHPRLINGPFDDPGLFIPFLFENRAVIFDLGDIYSLSSRDVLKISHAFITHTHMDHFIGFDNLLRLFLGREKNLYIYGPEGFLKNVEGKLAGYTWNLVDNFNNRFILHVTEVRPESLITRQYMCKNRFIPATETVEQPFNGILLKEPALSFSSLILDHSIPCLGFSLKERFHVNIIKDRVIELGLEIGPWLREFKQALFNHNDPDSKFEVRFGRERVKTKSFILDDLARQIAIITPGQKITYIADVGYSELNRKKIVNFAKDSDQLFIEAAFLEKDSDIARNKYHLTARQAGSIAGMAGVKQFTLFHFSPRYAGQEEFLYKEAMVAYKKGNSSRLTVHG